MTSHPHLRPDLALRSGYHSPQVDVAVRLNTNESPFPPPAGFLDALSHAVATLDLHRYPDRSANALRSGIARAEGVDSSMVVCANGSNEILQAIVMAFAGAGRSVVVAEPTYALHSHIANLVGCTVVQAARRSDFTVDVESMITAANASDAALIFLCSPNNPTGTLEPLDTITALVERTEAMVVVDEAYCQFAPTTALDLPRSILERVLIVRTFSKTWALAGVRLGYAISAASVIDGVAEGLLPYHLSSLTQKAGTLALDFASAMDHRVAAIVDERGRVAAALAEMPVTVWPSNANFILFQPMSANADAVWQDLVDHGVLVRNCSSWPGLSNCLRVTIGTSDENTAFLNALGGALQ